MSSPVDPAGPRGPAGGSLPRLRQLPGRHGAADARRAAIVESASELFAQSGYLNASLAQISAEAGTSATVALHHFGSKERLLMAVLERYEHFTVQRMTQRAEQGRLNSVRDLRDAAHEQAEVNLANPGLLQLFIRLSAEAGMPGHPAHEYFVARYRVAVEGMVDALTRAAEAGELREGTDVRQVAVEVLAVSDGLQVQWAVARPPLDLVAALDGYYDRLSRAVSRDGAGLAD